MIKKILFIFFFQSFFLLSQGQAVYEDFHFVETGYQAAKKLCKESLNKQLPLFNGSAYVYPPSNANEFPFFLSNLFELGEVTIAGNRFSDVPLLYDLVSDGVITELGNTGAPLELVAELISDFSLLGHQFVRLVKDTTGGDLHESGFYEMLYAGRTQVIARYKKVLQRRIRNGIDEAYYPFRKYYYIGREGVFVRVKSKGAVLRYLQPEKQRIKLFIREKNLNFHTDPVNMLVLTAQYYDTIRSKGTVD